ncbi:phytanoyl-CoA dioxygenase family protein [Catenulispora rubra]|uniref:phytanoyl-CoA dioxygenase family protein n=1 Tax=Catenulispora rubra TaxID=280293 RepID=UPI00189265E4|nr:phytanoyl-CoA dioxygenase family protein [Catenulispora rubra]
MRITDTHVENYRQNGFCVVPGLLPDKLVRTARDVVDRLLQTPDLSDVAEPEPEDQGVARRIWSPTSRDAVFEELAVHDDLVDAVARLVGDDVVLQYSKLNVKPPRVGSVVQWHQDFAYYPHSNTDLVACLIYLDDATRENACLRVAAGSHRHGLLPHEKNGYFAGKIASLEEVGVDPATLVECEGTAGTVVFLHPLVVHGSEKNVSDRYRRAFIPAYRAADAFPIYYGPHAAHNEPGAKLLRGRLATTARSEGGVWRLPIAEAEFNSLYEIQEGAHLTRSAKTRTGYFSHEESEASDG